MSLDIQSHSAVVRSLASLDDQSLVTAAKGGYSPAFAALCRRHRSNMLRTAYVITRRWEDAEDAVQDSLLRAFTHIKNFDGRSSIATWLTRIVMNSSYMILRKYMRRKGETSLECSCEPGEISLEDRLADHRAHPEKTCIEEERLKILSIAINGLPLLFKRTIELRLTGCSMKQIAEVEGISVMAAKSRFLRARRALRNTRALRNLLDKDKRCDQRLQSNSLDTFGGSKEETRVEYDWNYSK